jgi:membrane-associated phospholipid phosphatase
MEVMKAVNLSRLDQAVISLLLMTMALQMTVPQGIVLFQTLNHWFSLVDAQFWIHITLWGDTLVLLCLMAPLLAYRPEWLYGLIASIPLGGLLSSLLKKGFSAPRPGDVLSTADYYALSDVLTGHSFPSGHSITAFAMASVVWSCLQNDPENSDAVWIKTTVLSIALLIGCSRIALGVHWPIDVLAGACVGWMAGRSGFMLLQKFPQFWRRTSVQWTVMCSLLGIAVFLFFRLQASLNGEMTIYLCLMAVVFSGWTLMTGAVKKPRDSDRGCQQIE